MVGRLATRGRVPLGYYKDPERSARTFVEIDGARWSLPGDMATIDADGTVHLLGRGSLCINTGGEKVYPEEVEAVLKGHPAVADAVVVGAPDERFGQRVVAIVAVAPGQDAPDLETLARRTAVRSSPATRCRARCTWSTRSRARPAGKADYAWARRHRLVARVSTRRGVQRLGRGSPFWIVAMSSSVTPSGAQPWPFSHTKSKCDFAATWHDAQSPPRKFLTLAPEL